MNQYFNDSTGTGDEGETDARGPWNEGGDWEIVQLPELEQGGENLDSAGSGNGSAHTGRSKTATQEKRSGAGKARKLA